MRLTKRQMDEIKSVLFEGTREIELARQARKSLLHEGDINEARGSGAREPPIDEFLLEEILEGREEWDVMVFEKVVPAVEAAIAIRIASVFKQHAVSQRNVKPRELISDWIDIDDGLAQREFVQNVMTAIDKYAKAFAESSLSMVAYERGAK
jgi:hypothetical protein